MNWQLTIKTLLIIIISSINTLLSAQEMYPGDVNNNGIVNGVDFLFLGSSYNTIGPERENTSTDYTSLSAAVWNTNFPNGVNHAYADCDGNGKINNDDIEDGILKNFNLQHGNIQNDNFDSSGIKGTHPTLLFVPDAADSGNQLKIQVFLGDEEFSVEDFYGLTFDISFNEAMIAKRATLGSQPKPAIFFALANNAWFSNNPADKRHLVVTKSNTTTTTSTVAISRVDNDEETGEGEIGEFTIITVEVDAFRTTNTQLFTVSNVMLVDKDLNITPVNVKIEEN